MIAIHQSKEGFTPDWVNYCEMKGIPFKIVNCHQSNIIEDLQDCEVLLWHHHHICPADKLFAKQLLFALEHSGIKVFPNFNTGWHFDDKMGQKYLLEAIDAPIVKTFIFYIKEKAYQWVKQATFPMVFKLRCGAGSSNVKLVHSKAEANRLIKRAFGSGFSSYDKWGNLRDTFRKYSLKRKTSRQLLKSVMRLFISTRFARMSGREKGYVLFQEFIPNNDSDIRVIVIEGKAFAIKRMVRENDFRASGSGLIGYDPKSIDIRCVQLAFEVCDKLGAQCIAFDFIFDGNKDPLIVEINYGFAKEGYLPCPGYWDRELNWVEGKFNPLDWIIDGIMGSLHIDTHVKSEGEVIDRDYTPKENGDADKEESSLYRKYDR